MNCILSVLIYIAISAAIIVCYNFVGITDKGYFASRKNGIAIPICFIVLFSLCFTVYNICCTVGSNIVFSQEGDRYNYYLQFIGQQKSTTGLSLVMGFIRLFTDKFEVVLYFTTFVCCCMFFLAIQMSEEITVPTMVFFLLTDIVFATFVNLKQCYSVAFAYLMIANCIGKKKSLANDAINVILIVAAVLFHITAVILVPIYILLRFTGWQNKRFYIFCILFAVCVIGMKYVGLLIAGILDKILPSSQLAAKIIEYFGEGGGISAGESAFAFVKGLPFYLISVIGIVKRRKLKPIINHYDSFLFLSVLGSLFYFGSVVTYWIYRMIYYFYLPIAIFLGKMIKYDTRCFKNELIYSSCYLLQAVVFFRWLILIYVNYGGF